MSDSLADRFPRLARRLPKLPLADLPTPAATGSVSTATGRWPVTIKYDNLSAATYGGNKVRKLEYLLRRARDRDATRIATFGTVASNHAMATALYATSLGFDCTCLLSHQHRTPQCAKALRLHLETGTELCFFGGPRRARVQIMRQRLQGRRSWVIPAGGSSWLGVIAFVNAGLELAAQVATGVIDAPQRIYVANGTMATAAGIALGLALSGLTAEVHAIRVTHEFVSNPAAMRRLIAKTATLMHRCDPNIPADLADQVRLCFRDDFFAGGYAHSDRATDRAVAVAAEQLGIALETTYTGKAMAALLHDLDQPGLGGRSVLFWNTYNSRPLPAMQSMMPAAADLPGEFRRYFD
jgi:1-aminocyclopropane-1-carboxylate deaminase/D-cysteine desulfhydrase-like pyridoxal-dependent ACC family enzyme